MSAIIWKEIKEWPPAELGEAGHCITTDGDWFGRSWFHQPKPEGMTHWTDAQGKTLGELYDTWTTQCHNT